MTARLIPFLLLFLLVAGLASASTSVRNLGPDESYRLVTQQKHLFMLDVRTPSEYLQFRIAGARLIPISELARRLAEVPRDRPVLVYCAVGSRSAQVVNYLARKGYPEVYNMAGGIYAWANKGYPILQGKP